MARKCFGEEEEEEEEEVEEEEDSVLCAGFHYEEAVFVVAAKETWNIPSGVVPVSNSNQIVCLRRSRR
ncbi:hypothetical protein SprV_0902671200 [Sparganum proliferum]